MKDDTVMKRIKTNIDLIAEQIGADIADATATGDHFLLYERMIANLEDLAFHTDRMAGKLLLAPKDYRNE
jgi:hypothetical protein